MLSKHNYITTTVPHRFSNVVANAVAVDVAIMAVADIVGVLVVVAVIKWGCNVGVIGNSCFSRCCSAVDLLYII
jgi:hypothetical protein